MSAKVEPAERGSKVSGSRDRLQGPVNAYLLGRVGVVALVLAVCLGPDGFDGGPEDLGLLAFLVVALLLGALSALTGRSWAGDQRVVGLHLALDVVLTAVILHSEGGALATSPLFPLFFLPLLVSTQLLPLLGQGGLLVLSIVSFLVVVAGPSSMLVELLDEAVQLRIFAMALVVLLTSLLMEQVRRSAERELQRSEQVVRDIRSRQELLLDELSTGVLVLDAEGRVLDANPAASRLVGDVVGRPWLEVLTPGVESTWEQPDGSGRTLFCSRNALEAGGDVVLVEDVSEIRRMEADVARMERMAAVGRLAAGLAHEIRNPLASLSGSVQMLAEDGDDPLFSLVLGEVDRLNRLVEDFLDVSRPLTLVKERVELSGLVTGVAATFAHDPRYSERVSVQVEAPGPVYTDGDDHRLRQVIWNLLLNAAQHTPLEGRVAVRCHALEGEAVIEVEDDGVGIAPEEIHRIFDPFFTTRVGGTGLGLANVERIVTTHSGQVAVSSSEGEGTCFRVRLPLSARQEEDHVA